MNETRTRSGGLNRLKMLATLVIGTFAVTLAVVVGNRLSDEALAVLAGAVCGVGAAIPTSLLVVTVSRRQDEGNENRARHPAPQGAYPPVIVVTPPGGQQRANGWNALPPSLAAPAQRNFTVVGGAPIDTKVMTHERYY